MAAANASSATPSPSDAFLWNHHRLPTESAESEFYALQKASSAAWSAENSHISWI